MIFLFVCVDETLRLIILHPTDPCSPICSSLLAPSPLLPSHSTRGCFATHAGSSLITTRSCCRRPLILKLFMSSAIALPLEVSFSGKSSGSGGEPRPCPSHPPHARRSKAFEGRTGGRGCAAVRHGAEGLRCALDAPSPPVISM